MAETLKEKTAKGLFWGGMNNFVQQVVGLVFGIILGRLLSPSDYGMIAMITIFSQIANAIQLLCTVHCGFLSHAGLSALVALRLFELCV